MSGLTSAATSINEDEHRRFLCIFHHVLKLPFAHVRLFEFGGNFRDRLEEAQKKTALHRSNFCRTRMSGLTSAATSINEDEHRRFLCIFHHVLKLPFAHVRLFEFGGNFRDRLEEAQKKTALHRVIHPALRDPRSPPTPPTHSAWPTRCPPRCRVHPPTPRPNCPAAP